MSIKSIALDQPGYPSLLKEIYHPPKNLYYKGSLNKRGRYLLAIVGTRKPTPYGIKITTDLAKSVASRNVVIVSGLAYGIDSIAHQAALDVGGCTWAVLGAGLDLIYPARHRKLAENIIDSGGALISEYKPGTPPLRQHFPARNRIISGLSLGTLVIEAPSKSGALITAYFALEQNREVLAIPGDVNRVNSIGTNSLIKQGAKIVTNVDDVLELFDLESKTDYSQKKIVPDTKEERIIIDILHSGPHTVDQIIQKCKLDISVINSTLSVMELSGKIQQIESLTYTLNF